MTFVFLIRGTGEKSKILRYLKEKIITVKEIYCSDVETVNRTLPLLEDAFLF